MMRGGEGDREHGQHMRLVVYVLNVTKLNPNEPEVQVTSTLSSRLLIWLRDICNMNYSTENSCCTPSYLLSAASCKAVYPPLFSISASAPFMSSSLTTASCPFLAAHDSGV